MAEKRGRGRPSNSPQPAPRTNNDNSSSENNYKNVSLFPVDDGGNGNSGGDRRGKKKTSQCRCCTCRDSRLEDEINSIQKSISKTKQDTNEILTEIKQWKKVQVWETFPT